MQEGKRWSGCIVHENILFLIIKIIGAMSRNMNYQQTIPQFNSLKSGFC